MRFLHVAAFAFAAQFLAGCATPPAPRISDIVEARALSDQGLALFEAGDYENAVLALDGVIAFGSVDARDYTRRAAVLGAMKKYDAALKDSDKSLQLMPGQWRAHLQRAIFQQRLGNYDAAVTELDNAHAIKPDEVELVRRRSYLKIVAGRYTDAALDYDMLARMTPHSDVGVLGHGVALYLAGDWRAASAVFERMLTTAPDDGLVALWLGKASLRAAQPMAWEIYTARARSGAEWAMLDTLLSDMPEEQVLAAVSELGKDAGQKPGVGACEQALFMGAWRIIKANGDNADRDYRRAQKHCPGDSIEASEARVELDRLRRK